MKLVFKRARAALPRSVFAKSVMTLMTGTGLAQLLPILLSPILTRLYTPQEFGFFALYVSVCAILVVFVTGKYELAIVVPKCRGEAINLVALTFFLSLFVSFFFLGVVVVLGEHIALLLGNPDISLWLYLVPLATLVLGFYFALNFWANRQSHYKIMAISRVLQSGSSCAIQLTAGVFRIGLMGLIAGQLIGQFLSALCLAKSLFFADRAVFRRVSIRRMICVARKYIGYPKYMVPGQAMSVAATEMPLLLLSIFFGTAVAGFYSLAQRVMAAPLSLVANAVGDVYRQSAADSYAREGQCLQIFMVSLKRLVFFAFLPMLPVLIFGPWLFAFVFGENWRVAGEIASLLSVLVFFQTVSSPLSGTVLFAGWLHLDSLWQFSRLCVVVAVFLLGDYFGLDYQFAIITYAAAFSCLYFLHTVLQYKAAKGRR